MVSEAKFMEIRKLPGAELADFLPADRVVTSWGCAFVVTELRRLTGSYNTMVGNNEGSMVWIISNNY